MIQYDRDGATLFYIDTNGNRVSHGPYDGQPYADMLSVMGAQQQAGRENYLATANYNTALANAQISVNAGRAGMELAPTKPQQKVVSDTGVVSYSPFTPPLVDLMPLKTSGPGGSIAAPSIDKLTIMYNMIQAMFKKMFPDA